MSSIPDTFLEFRHLSRILDSTTEYKFNQTLGLGQFLSNSRKCYLCEILY